jgi:hypothetical protein
VRFRSYLVLAVAVSGAACASYQTKILDPWVGASRAELVKFWGYPQASTDVVKIDDRVTVYTYRSQGTSVASGQPSACAVSFAIEAERVQSARYTGSECKRVARP